MSDAPIVRVEQGRLQGKVVTSPTGTRYFSYQGIPYAKPPLGPLRFKDPEPHEPWEGIRDATTEGPVAAQRDFIFYNYYVGDENCLFLNIHTPKLDGAPLPVMFYIHGGSLALGSGNSDFYGPDCLVEKDVIIVTINYRLGPLGFLCLNTPEVPGNAGLKDVILALRWVNKNIHNFGGNAGNLTIFGQSAGGAITALLTTCPAAKNLFNRAIVQSGTPFIDVMSQTKPIENARTLAKALGCESENVDDILDFLRSVPEKDIIETNSTMYREETVLGSVPRYFSVVVEHQFPGVENVMPEPFLDLLISGRFAQVPVMVGTTTLEYGFMEKSDDLQQFIPIQWNIERDSEISLAIANRIKNVYFKGGSENIEYCQLQSDIVMNVGTHRYIQYMLQSSNIPVYFYKFDYVGSLNIGHEMVTGGIKDRAMHLDELGHLFRNDKQNDIKPTPQDLKVRERMVRLWTNFAKTGNPTPEINHYITVIWPPATKDNECYLLIGNELTIDTNYDKEKMDFWDNLYSKYFKIWEQPDPNPVEKREPVINTTAVVESEALVTETREMVESNGVVETNTVENKEAEKPESINIAKNIVNGSANTIKANDSVDDLPKNIGVNKYVDFYESLGGKK